MVADVVSDAIQQSFRKGSGRPVPWQSVRVCVCVGLLSLPLSLLVLLIILLCKCVAIISLVRQPITEAD